MYLSWNLIYEWELTFSHDKSRKTLHLRERSFLPIKSLTFAQLNLT